MGAAEIIRAPFEALVAEVGPDGVARVSALSIAELGEMTRARNVKKLFERHRSELEEHGPIWMRSTVERIEKTGAIQGIEERVVDVPWLNEAQAYHLLSVMGTRIAASLRVVLVRVFLAARDGRLPTPGPAFDRDEIVRLAAQAAVAALKEIRRDEDRGRIGDDKAEELLASIRALCDLVAPRGSKAWRARHRRLCTEIREACELRGSRAWAALPSSHLVKLEDEIARITAAEKAAAKERAQLDLFDPKKAN